MSASTLNVGTAGMGWMGQLHSRCYRRFTDHFADLEVEFALCTAATRSTRLAADATRRWGYRVTTDDAVGMAASDLDVVSICLPNHEHVAAAVAAAHRGATIWIEKPVGRSLAETARVHEAAKLGGSIVGVGYNYRAQPAIAELRRRIKDGRIGTVHHVRGHYDAGYAADPMTPLTWRYRRDESGGGASSDIMSHLIDLVQHVHSPIVSAAARLKTVHGERPLPSEVGGHFGRTSTEQLGTVDTDDLAAALVTFGDGSLGSLDASRISHSGENSLSVEFHGSDGYAHWDSEKPNEFLWREHGQAHVSRVLTDTSMSDLGRFQPGPGLGIGFDEVKLIELANLMRLRAGRPSDTATIDDALSVARVVDALQHAADSDGWIRIGVEDR